MCVCVLCVRACVHVCVHTPYMWFSHIQKANNNGIIVLLVNGMLSPGAVGHDAAAFPARARLQRGEVPRDAVAVAAVAQTAPGGSAAGRVRGAARRRPVLPWRMAPPRQR